MSEMAHAAGDGAPVEAAPAPVAATVAGPRVTADTDAVVEVRDVRKIYKTAEHEVVALDHVSLSVPAGRFFAIMGSSGSGKSTLMHLIGGLTPPSSGSIVIEGRDLTRMSDRQRTIFRRRRMGIVFQEFNLLPTLTARENVALPLLVDGKPIDDGAIRRVDDLLRAVHLEHRGDHRPDALSGGEQQRVAIARSLLNDPAILLADEPTGNLDSKHALEIWKLLQGIAHQGKTILMVTHEALGAAHADTVVVLKDGRIVGTLEPKGTADAALVATGYQELAG